MKTYLILILLGNLAGAATSDRKIVESLMDTYVHQAARGEKGKLNLAGAFQDRWDEDVEELADCKSSSCSVRMRNPVAVAGDDDQDLFEVQMDVIRGGQVLARRSGCYIIAKDNGQFILRDYKYECAE